MKMRQVIINNIDSVNKAGGIGGEYDLDNKFTLSPKSLQLTSQLFNRYEFYPSPIYSLYNYSLYNGLIRKNIEINIEKENIFEYKSEGRISCEKFELQDEDHFNLWFIYY